MRRYKGSVRDQWNDFRYWARNWWLIIRFFTASPVRITRALFTYPWLYDLLKVNASVGRQTEGTTGTQFRLTQKIMSDVVEMVIGQIKSALFDPSATVLADVMLPPQIFDAMGLKWFNPENLGTSMALMDSRALHRYMDLIENLGLPGDTCSFVRVPAAVVLAGHCPPCSCIVASNLPCDGGQGAYYPMQDMLGLPLYQVDYPYYFDTEDGIDHVVTELKGMISFLEKHTGHRMNMEKLRAIARRYNRMNDLDMEIREMLRSDHPPVTNFIPWMSRMLWFFNNGGTEKCLSVYGDINRAMKKAYLRREPPMKNMRYRAVLWNPPTLIYPNWFNWLERCWGIGILVDMNNYGQTGYLDTSSDDALLRSLAAVMCDSPMSRHTRGPYEKYIRDFFRMHAEYRADMVILASHIGCRNSMSMNSVIMEEARRRNVPLMFIDYELMDTRICSRQSVRDQVTGFMRTIMHAEPLDETLLVIDDAGSW